MTTIADLSRYDPVEAVDLYDGVILNIEDPGFGDKRARAISKNIPWGTYSWVYPGHGAAAAQRAHDAGTGPLGAWLDYEEEGVSPADLAAAFAQAETLGLKLGVYTYLYILPSVASTIGDHPLWLAYYPGANDGNYQPSYSTEARAAGALLHQYTSSSGTRDLSIVLDEPRWAEWTGSIPTPIPVPEDEDDMPFIAYLKNLDGTTGLMLVNGGFMDRDFGVAAAGAPLGLSKEYLDWRAEDDSRAALKLLRYDLPEWSAVRDRSKV